MVTRNQPPYPFPRQSTEPLGRNGTPQRPRLYSKYDNVEVLLLQWEDDDLGVNTEIEKLNDVLRSRYNFTTYVRRIPSEDAEDYLTETILQFRKGKSFRDLLMVYYGGHTTGSEDECIWSANVATPNPPTLNWLGVQGLLLEHAADVLLILDCCFATRAARRSSVGDNWLLGASGKESRATGVSWKSFTEALTRELERRAELHKLNGQPFTIQSIHSSLIWERDLDVTPVIIMLTERDCKSESTDLTPSPSSPELRLDHSPSAAPEPPSSSPPLGSDLPHRPRVPSKTHSTINALPSNSYTVRLSGLPALFTDSDIHRWLSDRLELEIAILWYAPLTTSPPSSTVVTFSSVATAEQVLAIQDRSFCTQFGGEEATIRLENDFLGLSCLYSSTKSPDGNPTVDLVFIHGTDGHAINSFVSFPIHPTTAALWPCTELPDVLEKAGFYPRIMTFGWDANVWLDPNYNNQKLTAECDSLRQELIDKRFGCNKRPIIFVGHGVGGLVVKQVVLDIINFAFNDDSFENPVKACFFFPVPHHSDNENGFASILAAMDSGVRHKKVSNFSLIESLSCRHQTIVSISDEFDVVRKEHGIPVHRFYEAKQTGNMYIVPENSAVLDRNPENSHRVEANFRDIIQLGKSESNLRQVLGIMRDTIQKKLGPKPARKSTWNKENVYARLRGYDTVFIVDDSPSMAGPRWSTTSDVLSKIAEIAVLYDGDGVDVRFLNINMKDDERLNLKNAEQVMKLFKKVKLHGSTPTADVLEDELIQYLKNFRENPKRKRLNLIVLTDGEPDDVQAVEEVIVKCANQLKDLTAHSLQVGVQFVQIGGDEKASEFLRGLDDDLVKKRNLDRDVSFLFGTKQSSC